VKLAPRPARLVAVLVLGFVFLTVAVVLLEKRLIYFPFRTLDVTPGALGLRHDELRLVTEDGVSLHAWHLPVAGSRFTVLLCHGNGGNISHRLDRVLIMHAKLAVDVLLFDYRGYGRSEGSPDEAGTYRDARAAYRYLREERGLAPDRIVLFGESLGAAVAINLALEREARALVLESPFTSIREMAREVYPFLPVGRFLRTRYDNLEKVPRLRVPTLVMHGERDGIVPFRLGRALFEAIPEPKRFYAIPGADHNDTYIVGGDDYWKAWAAFLASLE
jgi:fermentation-respiration switch protein FrsA (DUF1100 family)